MDSAENIAKKSSHKKSRASTRASTSKSQAESTELEKEKTKPLLVKSNMDTPESRALHVLDILAGLIMDILLFSEPEVAQQIKIFKF